MEEGLPAAGRCFPCRGPPAPWCSSHPRWSSTGQSAGASMTEETQQVKSITGVSTL